MFRYTTKDQWKHEPDATWELHEMPGTPIDIEAICQTIKQLMESLDGIDTSNAIHKRVEQTIERLLVEIETGLCTEQAK